MSDSGFPELGRVEQLFWMKALGHTPPNSFDEFVEDDLPDAQKLFSRLPFLHGCDTPDDVIAEMRINGKIGFFALLAAPVPSSFLKDTGGFSYSWGHYRTEWVYADSLDEIGPLLRAFEEEVISEARNALAKARGKA